MGTAGDTERRTRRPPCQSLLGKTQPEHTPNAQDQPSGFPHENVRQWTCDAQEHLCQPRRDAGGHRRHQTQSPHANVRRTLPRWRQCHNSHPPHPSLRGVRSVKRAPPRGAPLQPTAQGEVAHTQNTAAAARRGARPQPRPTRWRQPASQLASASHWWRRQGVGGGVRRARRGGGRLEHDDAVGRAEVSQPRRARRRPRRGGLVPLSHGRHPAPEGSQTRGGPADCPRARRGGGRETKRGPARFLALDSAPFSVALWLEHRQSGNSQSACKE